MTVAVSPCLAREPSQAPRRVLIIKPSSLGDVATALPLLCDLKRAFPQARIDWLLHPALVPLLAGHDALSEIILFDRKLYVHSWRSLHAVRGLQGLASTLRTAEYDCVIDAQGLLRSGLMTRLTGAPVRIGFRDAREGAKLFYTHHAEISRGEAVSVMRMRTLLRPLGVHRPGPAEFRMPVRDEARQSIAAKIPAGRVVGLIPGARGEAKRWPAQGFAEIARRVHGTQRLAVLLGAPDERVLCEDVQQQSGGTALNLAGKTNLAELIAAIDRCDLVIGNDTGPLHVAVALGKPVIGIYGPTDPASVGPYGQLDHVVKFARRPELDEFQHYRRQQETVERVWELARQLLPVGAA